MPKHIFIKLKKKDVSWGGLPDPFLGVGRGRLCRGVPSTIGGCVSTSESDRGLVGLGGGCSSSELLPAPSGRHDTKHKK